MVVGQVRNFLGWQQVQLNRSRRFRKASNSPLGNVQHARRTVTGDDIDATLGQKARIHSRAAPNVEYSIPWVKVFLKCTPNRVTLNSADGRRCKRGVVLFGDVVER